MKTPLGRQVVDEAALPGDQSRVLPAAEAGAEWGAGHSQYLYTKPGRECGSACGHRTAEAAGECRCGAELPSAEDLDRQ